MARSMMDFFQYRRSLDVSNEPTPTVHEYDYNYQYDYPMEASPYFPTFVQDIIFSLVISIISITFFIFILKMKELRRNPTCWLVINILVAAMIHSVLILPASADSLYGGWKIGAFCCHFYLILYPVNHMYFHIGILLLLISRLISFIDQKKHADKMNPKVVRILLISSVPIILVVCIIATYAFGMPRVIEGYGPHELCAYDSNYPQRMIKDFLINTLPVFQNVVFGFVTVFIAIAKRRKLTSGDREERLRNWQTIVLIVLIGFLNFLFCLPMNILMVINYMPFWVWNMMVFLENLFYLLTSILIMVLIPEIRIALGSCCKSEKKGENQPLVKPM